MTNLEKALALILIATVLLVTSVALWPLFHQPTTPTVIQSKSIPTWADHEAQYRNLVENIRNR